MCKAGLSEMNLIIYDTWDKIFPIGINNLRAGGFYRFRNYPGKYFFILSPSISIEAVYILSSLITVALSIKIMFKVLEIINKLNFIVYGYVVC
jgi:hypothetical protein